jgi:hypothetical protein
MGFRVHAYQYGGDLKGLIDLPDGNWLAHQ